MESEFSWVLLYSRAQGAYHVETLQEYRSKPQNGYKIVSRHESMEAAMNRGYGMRTGAIKPAESLSSIRWL